MSLKSQLNRAYQKYQTQQIKILKPNSTTGQLNAIQTRTFQELLTVYAYILENTKENKTEVGEEQDYTARIQIRQDDIVDNTGQDIKEQLDQTCRLTLSGDEKQWTIETMRPVYGVGNFKVIEIIARLPKEGNNIRYH